MRNIRFGLVLLGVLLIHPLPAGATVLIFDSDTGFGNNGDLPQGYGSRVISTNQGGLLYSLDAGPTPNVQVVHSVGGMPQVITWDSDFGDLDHVCMGTEPYLFQMKLVADPGYLVSLHSFDMACWPGVNYTINAVSVFDAGTGRLLFARTNVLILGDPNTQPRHNHFAFTNLVASQLLIQYDATNVDSDDVGIDNITFSQSGPLLSVALSGGRPLVSWSTNANTYHLETTTNLASPAGWSLYTNLVMHEGSNYAVSVMPTNAARFFRLAK